MYPVLLFLLLPAAHALYQTGQYTPSGADISPPRYIEQNNTWQFDITMVAMQGSMVVPLFMYSAKPAFDRTQCSGLVPLCCLYQILQSNLYNAELDAFLAYLGPCSSYTGMASSVVLEDAPQTTALATHTIPSFSAWCSKSTQCTLEVSAAELRTLAVDMGPDELLPNVVNRQLNVTFAFVDPTVTPLIQLVFSVHSLLFHDSNSSAATHTRHHSFTNMCSDKEKPPNAMWRADLLALNDTCVWFCKPDYILYPSSTDFFYITTQQDSDYRCWAEPSNRDTVQLHLSVDIPELSSQLLYNTYIANAMLRLQATITSATNVVPQQSIFYLQEVTHVLRQITWTSWVPVYRLELSVVLFMADCESDLENRTSVILHAIEDVATENTFIQALHEDEPSMDPLLARLAVSNIEGDKKCKTPFSFSGLYIVFVVVWLSLMCVLCFFCWKFIFEKAAGYRRHSFIRHMSPLVRGGFSV